jgi:hypothetical protein
VLVRLPQEPSRLHVRDGVPAQPAMQVPVDVVPESADDHTA